MVTRVAMPVDPGSAGWNAILPDWSPQAALTENISADFLVIGAGFAGLSAVRRLQQLQPSARIVLLEGSTVANGPAGRNSGFMIDLPHDLTSDDYAGSTEHDHRQTAMNRAAIRFAQKVQADYELPDEALAPVGKINAAATTQGMQQNAAYARHLDALGEPYRLLDAADMRALTGISYYQGGLWTPGTVMLQPALYIRGLATGLLQQASLRLFEHSPVVSLQRKDKHWQATTPQGSVSTPKVILAVNGLVERFGYFRRRLMHVFTYASMSRALTRGECQQLGGEPRWAFTPADPMGTTVRRISGSGGERIVIRNRFTYDPGMEVSAARLTRVAQDHRQAWLARFPMLADVGMEYCWGGRLCLSLNGVSALGEVEEGLYSACCQNGLGTAKGTAAGIIAAEQASPASQTLMPDYQPEALPDKLWPEPLMWLGANGYLRWKEWRAGREF